MTEPTITLGMRLQIARRSAGISAKELASMLNLTTTTISRYENDGTPVPRSVLYAYQDICAVPIQWLRGEVALSQETVLSRWEQQLPLWAPYRAA